MPMIRRLFTNPVALVVGVNLAGLAQYAPHFGPLPSAIAFAWLTGTTLLIGGLASREIPADETL